MTLMVSLVGFRGGRGSTFCSLGGIFFSQLFQALLGVGGTGGMGNITNHFPVVFKGDWSLAGILSVLLSSIFVFSSSLPLS